MHYPPPQDGLDSEEDSGAVGEGTVNNLSSRQLVAECLPTNFTSDSVKVSLDNDDLNVSNYVENNIVTGDN